MLFDLLAQHPGLARTTGYPDGEDHEGWIEHGQCVMAGIGNVHHEKYGSGINGEHFCLHMTASDVTPQIAENMHQYYFHTVMQGDASKRVINKNPHLSNKLGYVLGIFKDAKIVHIVRDCRAVVASWLAVMRDHPSLMVYWPANEKHPCLWLMKKPANETSLNLISRHPGFYPGGGEALFIDYWAKINTGILDQMSTKKDQLLTIRYEDLISNPSGTLSSITEFCELPSFPYSTLHIEKNTEKKHKDLVSERLLSLIEHVTADINPIFG